MYIYIKAYVIRYNIPIIIFNNVLSVRSTKNKKNKSNYFLFTYSFFKAYALCRSTFLTYAIEYIY